MEAMIVFICLFLVVFGICYLHFSTRNKERLALIEKGADASIFGRSPNREAPPVWKVILLNLGLLLMGIGLGIIMGFSLSRGFFPGYGNEPIIISSIFFMAGPSLVGGFFFTKKLIK